MPTGAGIWHATGRRDKGRRYAGARSTAPGAASTLAWMRADADSFYAAQCLVLERVASAASLPQILEAVVRLVEGQAEGMLCSLLLFDEAHATLHHGAAPSLPREYVRLIDGASIGPEAGSCGAAAFRRERVVVEDIATHPYWVNTTDTSTRSCCACGTSASIEGPPRA